MKNLTLYSSLILFFYFTFLLASYHIGYSNVVIDFFRELLTIPFMVILLLVFIMSIRGLKKEEFKIKSSYIYSLGLSIITIVVLVINTI